MGTRSLAPFFVQAAEAQARAPSSQATGGFSMFLGDSSRQMRRIAAGDFVEASQRADVTGDTMVRLRAIATAAPAVGDLAWSLSLLLDDSTVYSVPISEDRPLYDLAIPLQGLSGFHRIAARLSVTGTAGSYDTIVPSVEILQIAEEAVATLVVANRSPEPSQTRVRVNATLSVDVVNLAGLAPTNTVVYVGGIVAYAAGAFQNGFTGSATAAHGTSGVRFAITPPALLPSDADIAMRIVASVGAIGIDSTYTFHVEDITAPVLTEVIALSPTTIRVRFSEALVAVDPHGASDALNPARWAITAISGPERYAGAIAPIVVTSVEQTDIFEFVLTTDQEQTMNGTYLLAVSDVTDLVGNVVGSPSSAYVLGYACDFPAERTMTLLENLPDANVEEDETGDLAKLLGVLQEAEDLILCDIDRWTSILDPDIAPEAFIDAMLADLGNPFSFELTLQDKRRLTQLLVPIYQLKGTEPGIRYAIRFFMGLEVTLDYIAYHGARIGHAIIGSTFRLSSSSPRFRRSFKVVAPRALTDEERARVTEIVTYMKSSRWHLVGITEPSTPTVINHLQLGRSRLGVNWILH